MSEIKNVLIVCAANKTRSPAIAAFGRHFAEKYGVDVIIDSAAGVSHSYEKSVGKGGTHAAREAVGILGRMGLGDYISNHTSTLITQEMADNYDLILPVDTRVMDNLYHLGGLNGKCFGLKEYLGFEEPHLDIGDPHYREGMANDVYLPGIRRGTQAAYELAFTEFEFLADKLVKKIQNLGG